MEQGKRKKRYSHAGNFVFLFLVVVMLSLFIRLFCRKAMHTTHWRRL